LFRQKYLESQGITSVSRKNQLAPYAFLEWPTRTKPNQESPVEYFPKLWDAYVPEEQRDRVRFLHALRKDGSNSSTTNSWNDGKSTSHWSSGPRSTSSGPGLRRYRACPAGLSGQVHPSGILSQVRSQPRSSSNRLESENTHRPENHSFPAMQSSRSWRRSWTAVQAEHLARDIRRQKGRGSRCRLRALRHGHRQVRQCNHLRLDQRLRRRTRNAAHPSPSRAGRRPMGRASRGNSLAETRLHAHQQERRSLSSCAPTTRRGNWESPKRTSTSPPAGRRNHLVMAADSSNHTVANAPLAGASAW